MNGALVTPTLESLVLLNFTVFAVKGGVIAMICGKFSGELMHGL